MTWLHPLALVGLLALVVPILVHLFGRRVAKRQRFPSLRLLQLAAPTPTTRRQPSDILLLVLRCAVVAAAAFALAQPLWSTSGRERLSTVPGRVIIVDTSASMKRLTSDGRSGLEHAQQLSQALLDSAREGLVVQTGRPGANVAGAASWLDSRSGMREVVVISDFQRGAVSDGNLFAVPSGVGIRLRRVETRPVQPPNSGDSATIVRTDPATDDVDATWQLQVSDSTTFPVTVLAAPDDAAGSQASIDAVTRIFPRATSSHSIALVFPRSPDGADVRIEPLRQPWQGDFLLALHRSDLFRNRTSVAGRGPCAQRGGIPLRNAQGTTVATLGAGGSGSRFDVVVFSCAEAGTLAATALLAAIVEAADQGPGFDELEPTVVPDEILRQWERPATELNPPGQEDTSPDGRWLWLLALALLLVEEWLRRKPPLRTPAKAVIERQERVA